MTAVTKHALTLKSRKQRSSGPLTGPPLHCCNNVFIINFATLYRILIKLTKLNMRITPELIQSCYQYTNKATSDRELRMRALKINAIENLGATLNQFDCFDLSDNSIKKLENFPLLPRLKCLLLNNNRIYKISSSLEQSIPNLERLILTNNYVQELGDIDPLSGLKNLTALSLLNNPVTTRKHYRHYVIFKLPTLKVLDFCKVKRVEREQAQDLFSTRKLQEQLLDEN